MNIRKFVALPIALSLFGCSGSWVDAPQACMGGWGVVQMANLEGMAQQMFAGNSNEEAETKDLKEAFEQLLAKEQKKKPGSDKDVKEAREALEKVIALGARTVCGQSGKSYTGDWECTATQQRVKCK
jgi:hypothetical protein